MCGRIFSCCIHWLVHGWLWFAQCCHLSHPRYSGTHPSMVSMRTPNLAGHGQSIGRSRRCHPVCYVASFVVAVYFAHCETWDSRTRVACHGNHSHRIYVEGSQADSRHVGFRPVSRSNSKSFSSSGGCNSSRWKLSKEDQGKLCDRPNGRHRDQPHVQDRIGRCPCKSHRNDWCGTCRRSRTHGRTDLGNERSNCEKGRKPIRRFQHFDPIWTHYAEAAQDPILGHAAGRDVQSIGRTWVHHPSMLGLHAGRSSGQSYTCYVTLQRLEGAPCVL